MGTGTAPSKRSNSSRQFKILLFIWLMMFSFGVFAGVTLTKKAFGMPAWAQRVLGLEPIIADIKAHVTPAPVPAPQTRQPAETPETQPQNGSNDAPTQPTEITGGTNKSTVEGQTTDTPTQTAEQQPNNETAEQSPSPNAMDAAELERKVRDYNDLLNRVRSAEKSYKTARKTAADSKTSKEDLQAALDQQNTDMEEITGALRQAQAIYDEIDDDPQFQAKYKEESLALTIYPVPQAIKDLDADKLRFLKKRS
jgi:hypothetical protein